jgi:hypothetical protein
MEKTFRSFCEAVRGRKCKDNETRIARDRQENEEVGERGANLPKFVKQIIG